MSAPLSCREAVERTATFFLVVALAAAWRGPAALAWGTEEFGNKPVGAQPQWPTGLLDVINDAHRVYSSWVNGNENFYFSGDTRALNAAMEAFAKVEIDVREVVLLPVEGEEKSFEQKPVAFNWRLHAPSGIYLALALREKDSNVHFRKPTLFIHVAGAIQLKELKIPKGLSVLDADDLVIRAGRGLESKDQDIRGQAIYMLGQYSYAEGALDLLLKALEAPQEHVARSAAGALGRAGKIAEKALPALKDKAAKSGDEKTQGDCKRAAAAIEAAVEAAARPEGAARPAVAGAEGKEAEADARPGDKAKRLRETQQKIRELKQARRREK